MTQFSVVLKRSADLHNGGVNVSPSLRHTACDDISRYVKDDIVTECQGPPHTMLWCFPCVQCILTLMMMMTTTTMMMMMMMMMSNDGVTI